MISPPCEPARTGPIREAHEVLGHGPEIGPGLTCRWPDGRVPDGVVVFCHGLGSNGTEYAALSAHWACHGYLVVHPTFRDAIVNVAREEPDLGLDPDSDLSGWAAVPHVRARMHEILHSPDYWVGRVERVRAVMSAMPRILAATCGAQPPLPCAIAGHSFGAYTAQLLAGAEIDLPGGGVRDFRDPRFAAAILLSAQGRDQLGLRDGSWDRMDGPVLTVTGTLDRGAKGGDWSWKSEPFHLAPPGDKYLAVLDEGDHYLGGFSESGVQRRVPVQQEALRQMTLAFLDAHLLGSEPARRWLRAIGDGVAGAGLLFDWK